MNRAEASPLKIVSGGQTGVDRAALDVAAELGLSSGGWCPRGRRAEDGTLAERYPLTETPSVEYAQRTAWNARDSDGTLVLVRGAPTGGTALTIELADKAGTPCLVVDLGGSVDVESIHSWIKERGIRVLNIAGPRESQSPGIYVQAVELLRRLLQGPGA
jgi:hypothetical protein